MCPTCYAIITNMQKTTQSKAWSSINDKAWSSKNDTCFKRPNGRMEGKREEGTFGDTKATEWKNGGTKTYEKRSCFMGTSSFYFLLLLP